MDSQDDIVMYQHPNPHIRSFFTPGPIAPPRHEVFRLPLSQPSREKMTQLGNIGASIVQDLLRIPGIIEVRTRPREILLKKDASASWEPIVLSAKKILQRALMKQAIHLVKK